jgi:RsiW-degrading membrane proteinase PrsW (M82 family)
MQTAPKPSGSTRMAVFYLTVGSMLLIWAGIWFAWMNRHHPSTEAAWYICWGFLLTGGVLTLIGLFVGPLGRSAREADVVQTVAGTSTVSQAVNPAPPHTAQAAANGAPVAAPAQAVTAPPPAVVARTDV